MINNDETLQIANEWFKVLCNLLSIDNKQNNDEILIITTQCITFFLGKMNDYQKQKEFLIYLQKNLKNDNDFRYFIECYIKLINEIKNKK